MKFLSSQVIKKQSRTVCLDNLGILTNNPSPALFWLFEFYGAIIIMSTAKLRPKCVDENFQNMQKYLDNKSFSAAFMTTFAFYYYFKGNKYKAQKYTDKVIEFINNSGSTSEGDMTVLSKLKELKEKIDAMPNPEEIYGDDDA